MENCLGLRLGDVAATRRPPQFHRAESEHGDLKPGSPELAFRKICHIRPSRPTRSQVRVPREPFTLAGVRSVYVSRFRYCPTKSKSTNRQYASLSCRVIGPGIAEPTWTSLTLCTGQIQRLVDVRNASSALKAS